MRWCENVSYRDFSLSAGSWHYQVQSEMRTEMIHFLMERQKEVKEKLMQKSMKSLSPSIWDYILRRVKSETALLQNYIKTLDVNRRMSRRKCKSVKIFSPLSRFALRWSCSRKYWMFTLQMLWSVDSVGLEKCAVHIPSCQNVIVVCKFSFFTFSPFLCLMKWKILTACSTATEIGDLKQDCRQRWESSTA